MISLKSVIKFNLILTITLSGLLFSCGGGEEADKNELLDDSDTVKSTVLNVAGELFSVPSPIQTALLIQKSGITYDKSILSSPNRVNTFSTEFANAINLGVYGADLGYVSLYGQTQDALGYLASIKHLCDQLGISKAFEGPVMDRIKSNLTNKDSMMVLVGIAYRGSDAYLKENMRNDISGLILSGGWIESMQFSLAAYRSKPSDQIRYRIAEQKQALSSILKILQMNSGEEATELRNSLSEVADLYSKIEFKYNFVEPVHDTAKKVTYINSNTEVILTDELLGQISEKIRSIRDKIVNSPKS